jgi:hypothetical protein
MASTKTKIRRKTTDAKSVRHCSAQTSLEINWPARLIESETNNIKEENERARS